MTTAVMEQEQTYSGERDVLIKSPGKFKQEFYTSSDYDA